MESALDSDSGLDSRAVRAWLHVFRRALAAEVARADRRAVGREGLLPWAQRYLPRHFALPPSAMHVWLAEQLSKWPTRRGARLNVIGPRGGAKSTIATLAWPLWAALEGHESYIWIIGDSRQQAAAHLENLRQELEGNARLRRDYPQATSGKLRAREGRIVLGNGAAIEAFGAGQRIRGRRRGEHRPTAIVADDLQNDGHMLSPRLREKSREWFHGMLLPAGSPQTNVVNLATALHREALALELCANPGWESRVFAAIEAWPARMDLWEAWEAIYANVEDPQRQEAARSFYDERRAAMDEGAAALWPEREDLYALMRQRAEIGRTSFEREKQGRPLRVDACEFPDEYFREPLWFEQWPDRLRVKVLAIDPSKGRSDRLGDYSALVLLGVADDGTFLVEADLARRPTTEMIQTAGEWCAAARPDALGIETNQFQELLRDELDAELQRRGLHSLAAWTIDNQVSKAVRIRRLGPLLAHRRLRFRSGSPSTQLLVRQLQEFPLGDHDDGPDALEMAVRLSQALLAGRAAGDGLGDRLLAG